MNNETNKLLNAIGKEIFVRHYYDFKNGRDKDWLPAKFTENSRNGRMSKGKKIFRENLNIEALEIIIDSKRIDEEIVKLAKEILNKEK